MASTTEPGTQVVYVDVSNPRASDTNLGTPRDPVQTIGRAIELAEESNARSVPVRVVIQAGVYREALELRATGMTTSAPISFIGIGDVTVSGSDVFTGWAGGTDDVYHHAWDQIWGLAPLPPGWENQAAYLEMNPVIRRREMVFVDGESLLQQMSAEEMTAVAGSFFASEEEGQVSIHLPPGADMSTAVIEVAVRPFLLHIESRENITIKNIAFQHAATPMPGPAVSISRLLQRGGDQQSLPLEQLGRPGTERR